ncbi:MAG: ATP phosphoribosyltransferase regulatory subunit [Burkholderiaceae bacterium]|nr:ATP phosphoribosyltransferase regulatory subunit [Burkholderiaceae bacterium]
MSSAWLLPEHVADVLPAQARHIETLRRKLLDVAYGYGYELVIPPLLEHLESLLSGAGSALGLKTFKLVDQLSGRTLGVRADTTPQVARIDAHLLNHRGVTRLCYCGSVLHTRPAGPLATREPLQFGAEIYGHAGLEADLEVQELALDVLQVAGISDLTIDLGDARIVRGVLTGVAIDPTQMSALHAALAAKNTSELSALSKGLPADSQAALLALLRLYGGAEVIAAARSALPDHPLVLAALDDLEQLATQLQHAHPEVSIGLDLADLSGYTYYSGTRFAVYVKDSTDALIRGGRYDEVGAVFGRKRPAAGFSMDVKEVANLSVSRSRQAVIRSPWSEDQALRTAVRRLREQGETVVCMLPGHEQEDLEFACDRELVRRAGQWVVQAL